MITFNYFNLEYKIHHGAEAVFQGIKAMIEGMEHGTTYYHFVGHPDNRWNEIGMADRARREIVPIKVARQIQTEGLYCPSEWLIAKFGDANASAEHRNMNFFPEGVSLPIRFYCSGNAVYYIFDNGDEFDAVYLCQEEFDNEFCVRHAKLIPKLIQSNFQQSDSKPHITVCYDFNPMKYHKEDNFSKDKELLVKCVSSFVLLDLIANNCSGVIINNALIKKKMNEIIKDSKRIEMVFE